MPIGRPLANTRLWILDARGEPVPVGVPGEIHIGGDGVARGYLGRSDLTAERFVPNAFGRACARMYRTGDRARYLPDGRIEFIGRIDRQVKLRGFRIEPGEIEALLAQQADVRSAAVLLRADLPGGPKLVAYVGANGAPADLVERLRARLRASLPEHMVPAQFVVLEQLPLMPNGKVDVKALPAIVARVKRVFDLGADIATIGGHLARDPKLAPLIAKRPGLRAPGEWDRETVASIDAKAPPSWRPWHAYAAQHLRMANHG